ncbi:hypothetical protein MYSTI_07921 [Myxococcus stipitatus DSM 14675]|uniref:Uncharacterized protein n=1 Tax=Myxococcus stipitatus (strain DSM 14675 / JCM 12634 / Mx s8) TaxID=1278073 RepID=L7UMF3_MYXSD|nr:hypothetical protein MYSTI_07921 [Myxococcus stipitatus DSM 14675]
MLNAFRHHGEPRVAIRLQDDATAPMCSTPSGITASHGLLTRASPLLRQRAQRLPASRRATVAPASWASAEAGMPRCSTPSGITASHGVAEGPELERVVRLVLNAFRHHGEPRQTARELRDKGTTCSTPSGITASHGRAIAGRNLGPGDRVLNAFRHHGEPRVEVREGCHRHVARVLNAFRHHGEPR